MVPALLRIVAEAGWLLVLYSMICVLADKRPPLFRSNSALLIDIVEAERLPEIPALGPEAPHVIGESCFTSRLSVGGHRAA